jgi:hypothetical protein
MLFLKKKSVSEIVEDYFQNMRLEERSDAEEFIIFGCLSNQFDHEPSDDELKSKFLEDSI